jgi:hypothetical protein
MTYCCTLLLYGPVLAGLSIFRLASDLPLKWAAGGSNPEPTD